MVHTTKLARLRGKRMRINSTTNRFEDERDHYRDH
jgi:hypothetical protein